MCFLGVAAELPSQVKAEGMSSVLTGVNLMHKGAMSFRKKKIKKKRHNRG